MTGQQHRGWCEDAAAGHPAGEPCRLYGVSVDVVDVVTGVTVEATLHGSAVVEVAQVGVGRTARVWLAPGDAVAIGKSLLALGEKFAGGEPRRSPKYATGDAR